jgi:NDP-sugar pyrophosphorylase family protein
MKIMFLTAGLGTRLRPATLVKPKPALELLNVPLLAYGAHLTACLHPEAIVANTHYLPTEIETLVRKLWPNPQLVHLSDERAEILGSGGGVSKSEAYLQDDHFLYANGDEVFLPVQHDILRRVQAVHESGNAIATLVVIPHALVGTKFGGVWADPVSGDVAGFGKQSPIEGLTGWHFTGYMFLSKRVFKYLAHDRNFNILYDGLVAAMKEGEAVKSFHVNGDWFEVGHTPDFFSVTKLLLRHLVTQMESESTGGSEFVSTQELSSQYLLELTRHYNAGYLIWNSAGVVTVRSLVSPDGPSSVRPRWTVEQFKLAEGTVALIAGDAHIEGQISISGFAVIGARSRAGLHAKHMEDSILMSDSQWPDRATLKNEMIVL